ncbi:MAG: DUF2723 domain-containing protein [Saprospirales bacterium]|nr:MAG: DUF2723 domain-containing protein [Saprospirales bacterium]
MLNYTNVKKFSGLFVLLFTFVVFYLTAERTTSLWDCGEFILAAYKVQVVHPPGAPLFIITGRFFTLLAELLSSNPADIAFAINLMSGLCTALAAMFISWVTIIFGRMIMTGRDAEPRGADLIALAFAGIVAGLATAFSTSVWFSAVEGEVYAMSTFFSGLTIWSFMKWYELPDTPESDRWIFVSIFTIGLSIGVHLLSLLAFPMMALLYYFKKYDNHNLKGGLVAIAAGTALIPLVQNVIITGIPTLWMYFDLFTVNVLGLPFNTGIIPTILVVGGILFYGFRWAEQNSSKLVHYVTMGATLMVISFSLFGVVVIRALAGPPVNMNEPSDPIRLLSYLNREQYGERPLFRGPHFDARPVSHEFSDRYGRVDDQYEVVEQRITPIYASGDKVLFPRMGHMDANRIREYRRWIDRETGTPTMGDNIKFFWDYQIKWMYWRYFMWNFSGRQNGEQGHHSWNPRSGHWYSGITPLDEFRLHNESAMPTDMKEHKARNKYYMLPFLFGLLGLLYHYRHRKKEFSSLMILFLTTGIGIIIYSNQPPMEPRERDYVLVGSFFTYCMWMGMGVLGLYEFLKNKIGANNFAMAGLASALVLTAPMLMLTQTYAEHDRSSITAARDYASNFLESCEPNAIIFTYGDNDTYPLWYAQEVEGIRRDVRVVNLSLIAVDWYINQQRRKINESPPINFTISEDAYRGSARNQVLYYSPDGSDRPMSLKDALEFIGGDNPIQATTRTMPSYLPSRRLHIPIDTERAIESGLVERREASQVVNRIEVDLTDRDFLVKDELAVLDLIASNIYDRPIYFSVTARPEKLLGLEDYMQLEGLGLRLVPIRSQSDPTLGIYGSGRVNTDASHERFTERFRFGNFDKKNLFVDRSYQPSVQAHRLTMMRTGITLLEEGRDEMAADIGRTFLNGFPNKNFTFDPSVIPFIQMLVSGGDLDEAKRHTRTLAEVTREYMLFFESLDPSDLNVGWSRDRNHYMRGIRQMDEVLAEIGDEEFEAEILALIDEFR